MILTALLTASASSLDLVEVGGLWGSPNATDATSLWWNPASMAAGHGTRFNLQAAPTFATVNISRTDPGYVVDPSKVGPTGVDYGGTAKFTRTAVVPFLGVVSDFGQPGLGVGLGVFVPHGRGAGGPEDNVVSHTLIKGGNQAIYVSGGAAYEIADLVSFGLTGSYVASSYSSYLHAETASALNDSLVEERDLDDDYYSDTTLEDPNYRTATQTQGPLRDSALTFGVGARVQPHEMVSLSLTYHHGFRIDNRGTTAITFDCPPNEDSLGRAGAQTAGICHSTLGGNQTVGYTVPGRLQGGIQVRPVEGLFVEAFGGWVNWKRYTDLDITIEADPDTVPLDDAGERQATADRVSKAKQWARDARNTYFLALDGKYDVHERVTVGARVLYDKASVPDDVVSANNYDANTVAVSALIAVDVTRNLQLGASIGQYISAQRTVTDSKYGLTIPPSERREARYFYASTNGTYAGSLTRLGFSLRGHFDHGKSRPD